MGVFSTRPSTENRQKPALNKRLLAVFLFSATIILPSALSYAATSLETEIPALPETTSSIAADTAHEVAISVVEPGSEQISLAARLTATSNLMAQDIHWQMRNAEGELLFDETATESVHALPPGDYVVEAEYGSVHLRETVTLPEGHAIAVSFVLNAGGLRVLPVIKGIIATEIKSQTLVYALSGPERGKLVAHSKLPGEVLKLAAGRYRIESRFGAGNTIAVTDVHIRPGIMSAIDVKHQAGLARLSFVGEPGAKVTWEVRADSGPALASFEGISQDLALKPGTYVAAAHVNGEVLTAKFKILAGQERDIMLGN